MTDRKIPSVLVIGDVMTDVVVRPEGLLILGADRRAKINIVPGGSGANAAAWLAAEGIDTTFVGRVGATDVQDQALALSAVGVRAVLAADPVGTTGRIVSIVSPDGERSFLTDRGANDNLKRADLPDALLDKVELIHLSGYSLISSGPRTAVLDYLEEAARREKPFTVDASSSSFLEEAGAESFLAWTRRAMICFANDIEAAVLSGRADPDAQLEFLTAHYGIVVIKLGARGAVAGQGGRRWSAAALSVEAIDTSGAGDAFTAGFLAAFLAGESIENCLPRGVDRGALAVTCIGARPPIKLG